MKRITSTVIALLLLSACTIDFKANQQISAAIKNKVKAISVTVSDGVEANTNGFNGSKKEIVVDLGGNNAISKTVLVGVAYHCADTAYQILNSYKEKLPSFFQIRVKAGGMTSDNINFKSSLLAKNNIITAKIKTFMAAVVARRYTDLPGDMEPGLNLEPITSLLKNADASGNGVSGYQFIGLQHAMGFHNPDKKPMEVIQGWVMLSAMGTKAQYPMLFVANPATNQLSSVYINPK
ncbi:hypothetical protein KXD93_27200 [Mucilaginibacter sp. BJC16-A38]|uniref:hypothetical protein n=1 Tax=Mucilaginibacter phenanthrenivorans TaxID=1234842 RepID=UPI0021583F9A|nr:hypothetical protein [Mucilaginibacter phenanthrenivorans]MCR8561370.1 hypothetical protein [Mucilaginibacter phenanthrenivorans]